MTEAQSEWARCKPFIEAAIETSPGFQTIEDVESGVEHGHYQFWPGVKSAAVTEIQAHPTERVLMVLYGGGDLEELMGKMEPEFCKFAEFSGCSMVAGTGRKGWERVSRVHGYEFGTITMVKRLKGVPA